jgi:hypothetical protein
MRVLSYIFLLVFIINLNAKKSWMIKGGGNVSSFQDNDSEPNRNYSIGLSKNIIFHKNPSMFWELLFTEQGAQIQDEPVKTIYYPFELYAYDISVSILYAELPLFSRE